MRIFLIKVFAQFARKERIADAALREAVTRAEAGLIDAYLGGSVIKQRIARAAAESPEDIERSFCFAKGHGPCSCTDLPRANGTTSIGPSFAAIAARRMRF